MDAFHTSSATELLAGLQAREFSSAELLDAYLQRVERLDTDVNAVVTINADRARAEATAADNARARGEVLGPLHGLPCTIKDAIATEGLRSTGGAVELTDNVPVADAPAVARLRRAGAIVFGKTNLPRWSLDVQSFNDLFGTTRNPWALDRTCGGSSGGAAAAVACGFTAFELGTDIGGSIRLPSHFCGVFGLKPTYGLIPQRGYLDREDGGSVDADINVFGPIARSAPDLDLLLGVLAGPLDQDAIAWRCEPPPPRARDIEELRVGVWIDEPAIPVAGEYRALLRRAADALANAGARVEDSHPGIDVGEQLSTFSKLVAAATSGAAPRDYPGYSAPHADWLRTRDRRARLQQQWAEWFDRYDVLLCPAGIGPAFAHDHTGSLMTRTVTVDGTSRRMVQFTAWLGLIGVVELPSAVAPVGLTDAGLPVGVQLVASRWRDREAINAASLLSSLIGGYRPPPGFGPSA